MEDNVSRYVFTQLQAPHTSSNLDFSTRLRILTYTLGGTGWGTDRETFSTTTMTHQLHCLFMMTHIYAGLATNDTSRLPHDYNSHYLHCIDYLRQGVMCAADLATEPHRPTDSDDNGPGDGSWGGLHVCKDYGQVTEYLEREWESFSLPLFSFFYFPKSSLLSGIGPGPAAPST